MNRENVSVHNETIYIPKSFAIKFRFGSLSLLLLFYTNEVSQVNFFISVSSFVVYSTTLLEHEMSVTSSEVGIRKESVARLFASRHRTRPQSS